MTFEDTTLRVGVSADAKGYSASQRLDAGKPSAGEKRRAARTRRMIMDLPKDGAVVIVHSPSVTLDNVGKAVGALSDKLDRRSATPWAVIWGAMGTCVTVAALIGGLAFYPLKDGQADLKSSLLLIQDKADKRIEGLAANQVTRAEHEVHWRSQDRDYDFMRDRIGRVENRAVKGLDEMKARLDRMEDRVVSRSEVLARNDAQDRVTSMLRGEVDEHVRAFNDRQQRRIDTLEAAPRR